MLFYPQWIIYNRIESFNLVQYRLQIYKCYCELPEHVEAFTLPAKLRMLEVVSPIKFVQLVLLILFLPVIFPVPQNKIIYIGGSYWHFERNNSHARLTYALKCQQNRPPNRTTKKNPLYVPTSSGELTASDWEPLAQVGSFGTILIPEASVPFQFLVVSWFLEFAD